MWDSGRTNARRVATVITDEKNYRAVRRADREGSASISRSIRASSESRRPFLVEQRPDTDAVEGEPCVAAELCRNGFHPTVARARSLLPM
jgi:hypothetical protein